MSTAEPETPAPSKTVRYSGIAVVWLGAIVAAVVIGILAQPEKATAWLGIALGACTVGSLVVQLAIAEKRGFVARFSASVVGALVVLAVTTGVLALADTIH